MKSVRTFAGRGRRDGPGWRLPSVLTASPARAALVAAFAVLLSAAGALYGSKLTIDSDFSKLIPPDYPSVKALERLRTEVGGESESSAVIESPSFEANVRFAEDLIPRVLALRTSDGQPFFTRVDYKRDIRFLEANALYLATDSELDSIETLLAAEVRSARLEANPFYFELDKEDVADDAADPADRLRAAYTRLVGSEYPISPDSSTLVLRFYPVGAQTDVEYIKAAYDALRAVVGGLDPTAYHTEMEVLLAGRLLRQLIEVENITDDVRGSFGVGSLTVLLMVVSYFCYKAYRARAGRRLSIRLLLEEIARAPITGAVIGLPLTASLCWTFGTAYFVFGTLNLMTSTLALVLFGLGIDYGIHVYGRYVEERGDGLSCIDAIHATLTSTGKAVSVTAFTTSVSFFVLTVADFRGFSEFGFIAGVGILYALAAMTVFLPALLIVFEQVGLLRLNRVGRAATAPVLTAGRFPAARGLTLFGAVSFLVALALLPGVSFEYDFGKLDPVYAEYQDLQRHVRKVYDDNGRRNPAFVVVDDPHEIAAIDAALVHHVAADTLTPTIGAIETLQRRFPETRDAQQEKLTRIAHIRALLDDPLIRGADDEWLDRLRRAASTTAPLSIESIPAYVRSSFTALDGSTGRLLLIYPSVGLSDARQSMAFADDVAVIRTTNGLEYHAGSTTLIAADMLRLMTREAPLMVVLALTVIVGIKLMLLRSVRWTAIAMLPLIGGFTAMFALAALVDVSLNFYNLVVLPVVLGVSDDAGIHLAHRYMEEGRGSIVRVLKSTGEHILMSALTTMVGFGGLILSFYPGLRSIGWLALLGIGATLVSALLCFPALLQFLEDRSALEVVSPLEREMLAGEPPPTVVAIEPGRWK